MHLNLTSLTGKLLLLLCLSLGAGRAAAQSGNVSFPGRSMTAKEAFDAITKQTGYMFAMNHSAFDDSKTVTFAKTDISVKEALAAILKGTGCAYEVNGKHILIVPAPQPKTPVTVPRPYQDYFITETVVKEPEKEPVVEVKTTRRIVGREFVDGPVDTLYRYPQQTKTIPDTKTPSMRSDRFGLTTPPVLAVKTNLLYGAAALAPNLGVEIGLGKRTSLDLWGSYNPWNLDGTEGDNKKLVHWIVKPEFRYWLCERFNGHFFGAHAFYWQYNVSGHDIPLLFDKPYRYEGNAYGAGLSYGYHWMIGKRWGVEFNVGGGVAFMRYDKYDCEKCGDKLGTFDKTYIGPTSAGIKLIFIIK